MRRLPLFHTLFFLLLFCTLSYGQRAGQFLLPSACSGNDAVLSYHIAQVDRCNDLLDIAVELSGDYIELMKRHECDAVSIEVVAQSDRTETMSIRHNTDNIVSFFSIPAMLPTVGITLRGKDPFGNTVFDIPIQHSTRKRPEVLVSDSFLGHIIEMGRRPANPLAPPTVGEQGDVFTYWCGRRMNVVMLLAFYQDYLGLDEYHICRIIEIIERYNQVYTSTQSLEFKNIYCQMLWEFWDDYVLTTGDDDDDEAGEEEEPCECKVISTGAFVNHSIGESTGQALEDCPDVSLTEGNKVWSDEGTLPNTNKDNNWLVTKWGYMGAAKSLYTISHHYESGDNDRKMQYVLPFGILKSSVTFALKCVEPRNAAISDDCDCEKTITAAAQYNSTITGQAATDGNTTTGGNGSVNSCMEDFAFFTRFSRAGFDIIESGAVVSCVQCESTDSTNFLTDLGNIASGIEDIVPSVVDTSGFNISNIDDIILGAGTIVDLVDNFLQNLETCGIFLDTSYVLINKAETFTLSPSNDFVSYIITSRAQTRTDFKNDEAWSELHLLSNYYLAAGLESDGDSTCCNELVGAYTIGHLGDFTESQLATVVGDQVDFEGFEFQINNPKKQGSWLEDGGLYQQSLITLLHLQTDAALVFAGINPFFLEDVFGIDCGPGCTAAMDCYYDCGFWGDCHEDPQPLMGILPEEHVAEGTIMDRNTAQGLIQNSGLNFRPTNAVKVFPNPIRDGYELTIRADAEVQFDHVYIFNLQGQLLAQQPIANDGGDVLIPSAKLQNGVNMVVLKSSTDDAIFVERIVKE